VGKDLHLTWSLAVCKQIADFSPTINSRRHLLKRLPIPTPFSILGIGYGGGTYHRKTRLRHNDLFGLVSQFRIENPYETTRLQNLRSVALTPIICSSLYFREHSEDSVLFTTAGSVSTHRQSALRFPQSPSVCF